MNNEKINVLTPYIKEFIDYKHYCGYKYNTQIRVLSNFASYYDKLNINTIEFNRSIIEPFLTLKENERIGNQVSKATILRQFGKFLFLNGYINELYIIPPISQKGEKDYIPYIFTKEELRKICNFFDNYNDIVKLPKGSFEQDINMLNSVKTIIKILMFTGMRINEVCSLKLNNIDLKDNIFYVDEAKNDNQRLVPFSNTLKDILNDYIDKSNAYLHKENNYLFFHINRDNIITKVSTRTVYFYFRKALKYLKITHKKGLGPRLHDFRHTYSIMALTQLSKIEKDINTSMAYLSTYLGHKSFRETQKYIWLTPELFDETLNKMTEYSSRIKTIFDNGDDYEK